MLLQVVKIITMETKGLRKPETAIKMRGSCHSCWDQSHPLPSAGLLKVMQGRGLVRATLPWESGPILGAGCGRRYQESHPRPRQGFLGSAPCFRGRRHSLDSACGQGWERGLGGEAGSPVQAQDRQLTLRFSLHRVPSTAVPFATFRTSIPARMPRLCTPL